jgi:hypothetical protein
MAFTADEVESLNAYQLSGRFHPFTCGTKEKHVNSHDDDVLAAGPDGFHCPSCDHVQGWAHEWMKNWSWRGPASAHDPFASSRWTRSL